MPSMRELGKEYISFPILFGGDGGYEIRVIAVQDDTIVTVPTFDVSKTLNMGEFHLIDNPVTNLGFIISCSKPCMTVQYVRSLPEGFTETMRAFMAVLVPQELSCNDLIFTIPRSIDFTVRELGAISIITNTFPASGLHLNDTSLAELDWQPIENSLNWFASVGIEAGFHHLYSTDQWERSVNLLQIVETADSSLYAIRHRSKVILVVYMAVSL